MPPKWPSAPQGCREGGRRLKPRVLAPRSPASPCPLGWVLQPGTSPGLSITRRAVSQHGALQVLH